MIEVKSVCNAKSLSRSIKCVIVSVLIFFCLTATVYTAEAVGEQLLRHSKFVFNDYSAGDFKLVFDQSCAVLYVDAEDFFGVERALKDLQKDIERVTGLLPEVKNSMENLDQYTVIVGTIGQSRVINDLIENGSLDIEGIEGKWESYVIQVVSDPIWGVNTGLVIAGSDKRGTIYGIYEISRQIGVSPWYWWADVTPDKQDNLVIRNGIYKQGEPSVKYRGIFLNNEAPSLSNWVRRFGGFNSRFYEHVFELVLRLRANFLWPAMWSPKSFFRDDPMSPYLADEYGVVIGTSHHEPMMRSWGEWGRYGLGEWNYSTNQANLLQFWDEGIQWAENYEKIVTVGMRGDGDEPMMHDGTIAEQIAIMEEIIRAQREILSKRLNPDVTKIPQVWALYKEVQELYENGMQVPEDITILLSNDNFGNIRMLPKEDERDRLGGFGMYYHFDYVGGPRSYRWVNSTPNPKIWEQMSMAYDYGVDRIWIVNVGDLKPHEIATEFFLELTYDINKWNNDNLAEFTLQWAEREFGRKYAAKIAEITDKYRKFTSRRKSEIVEPETYSLINYKEAETVLAEFEEIVMQAEAIYDALPADKKDAFFQLVLYPARASKNVLKANIYAGLNNMYAQQGRTVANLYVDLAEQVFKDEALDTNYYNNILANGKWRGIMSNAHIGQTGWQSPEKNIMPKVERIPLIPGSDLGVIAEGTKTVWIKDASIIDVLPTFSVFSREKHYIDIFNLKQDPFSVTISASHPWILLNKNADVIHTQSRIWIEIDWEQVPVGESITGEINIAGTGKFMTVIISVDNPDKAAFRNLDEMTFIESNGYAAIEAEHYWHKVEVNGVGWQRIADYGRTLSSMAVFPTTCSHVFPPDNSPYMEYKVYINQPGTVTVIVYTAPTNNINRECGLSYGISFNDEKPQIVDTFPKENDAFYTSPLWSVGVMDNIRVTNTRHKLAAGVHTLKFWMVDPGVVLQKIVINTGGVKPSYLGPPESYFIGKAETKGKEGYLQLLTTFDYANYLAKNTVIGENHGQTTLENFNILLEEIFSAKEVLGDKNAGLKERLNLEEQVKQAIDRFKANLVYKEGYDALQEIVMQAQAVLAAAKIGNKHEEYPLQAKKELESVMKTVLVCMEDAKSAPKELKEMNGMLEDAIEIFKDSMIINPYHRVIYPTADTFIRDGGSANTNYGNAARLELKYEADRAGMSRIAFLKFDLSDFAGVEQAALRLFVEFSDVLETRVLRFYDVTGIKWSENSLTWENVPLESGTLIVDLNVSNESGLWYEIDLTEQVKHQLLKGSDEISIRIENKTSHWGGAVFFTSKEGEKNHPELRIIVQEGVEGE